MPTFETLKIARLPQSLYIQGHDHAPVPNEQADTLDTASNKTWEESHPFSRNSR